MFRRNITCFGLQTYPWNLYNLRFLLIYTLFCNICNVVETAYLFLKLTALAFDRCFSSYSMLACTCRVEVQPIRTHLGVVYKVSDSSRSIAYVLYRGRTREVCKKNSHTRGLPLETLSMGCSQSLHHIILGAVTPLLSEVLTSSSQPPHWLL
jgi:hypothetical protein